MMSMQTRQRGIFCWDVLDISPLIYECYVEQEEF